MAAADRPLLVTSADGTRLAYEVLGDGPPLITVTGATATRDLMRPTAEALGEWFTSVNYDRRGRGASGDTLPYAVEREVEDLAVLIEAVGAPAHLYGHSSGAGLVLHAVAAGLPVRRFVLHDPPYSADDQDARDGARRFARHLVALLEDGRRGEAITAFFGAVGMPDEMIDGLRASPGWDDLLALAHTLAYDSAVMGDIDSGGAVPDALAQQTTVPGLVLVGDESPPFMLDVGRQLASALADGELRTLPGPGARRSPRRRGSRRRRLDPRPMSVAATIDEYLGRLAAPQRQALLQLRALLISLSPTRSRPLRPACPRSATGTGRWSGPEPPRPISLSVVFGTAAPTAQRPPRSTTRVPAKRSPIPRRSRSSRTGKLRTSQVSATARPRPRGRAKRTSAAFTTPGASAATRTVALSSGRPSSRTSRIPTSRMPGVCPPPRRSRAYPAPTTSQPGSCCSARPKGTGRPSRRTRTPMRSRP